MNECYTYFNICGDFDPDEISAILELTPFRAFKKGDLRRNGKSRYDFSSCCYCKCDVYNYDVNEMICETIAPLRSRVQRLAEIREKFGAEFSVVVVPTIYANESTPALGPNLDIIDFCHAVRATIDIDMYLSDSDD